jgi:hypothetical protein
MLDTSQAISFLEVTEKEFLNYRANGEIPFQMGDENGKYLNRYFYNEVELKKWLEQKNKRTIELTQYDYEKCFEFAMKMAYSGKPSGGSIRGVRSEMQIADDFILGILAEHTVKKFLQTKFGKSISLDEEVHPEHITAQDIDKVQDEQTGNWREPKIGVAIKASKLKNMYLILGSDEYESSSRKSDYYIFVRVGLPSDHLFRILRDHSFFKNVKDFLDTKDPPFRKIEPLGEVFGWVCGYVLHNELEKVDSIPGQTFDNPPRYVKSVSKLKNSESDWKIFINNL